MKSAEHWEDVIGNIPEPVECDPHGFEPYWEQLRAAIRAIQADALEAAALEVEDEAAGWGSISPATDALGNAEMRIRKLKPTGGE